MNYRKVDSLKLERFCKELLIKQGLIDEEAELISKSLVEADMRGVSSHGVSRLKIYMKRMEEGVVSKIAKISIEREYPGSIVLNAHNSMGIVAGVKAIDLAIEKAKKAGAVFATVKHSNHFGTASFFTKRASRQGFIAFAASNAPPNMAPWGASEAYIGTNPLSIAIPMSNGEDIVLDMATSVVAQGKIIMAAKNNESIPEGWAITKDGKPTTDANEALNGTVLPFGGHKGYGIALIIDILSGILSGSDFGPYLHNMWTDFVTPQNVGHVFLVLDISKFIDTDIFFKKLDTMKSDIKNLSRAEGVKEVFLPGEMEDIKAIEAKKWGVNLYENTINDLKWLSERWGVIYDIE